MTVLTEGNLQITINNAASTRKFDGPCHGLSYCMKAVDFVVEFPDHYLFIEIKDPQDPQASLQATADYYRRFTSGQIDEDFKYKYRDTFLYEWAAGRANKPIDYLILIAVNTLKLAHLHSRTRDMERKLPLLGPASGQWTRPIVRNCYVLNITSWNRHFPQYPVTRLPP